MTHAGREIRPDRTTGPRHDEFWTWCGRRKLHLQLCDTCRQFQWPVAVTCEKCGGANLTFEPLSGRGEVVSWATFERDYYQGLLPIPWDTILVQLAEGPLFISNPLGFNWREITPSMPVEVAFIDVADSKGSFSLPVFKRLSGAASQEA